MADLTRKHQDTLERIFRPQKRKAPGVTYREMVKLVEALGGTVDERREGSRVRFTLPNGSSLVTHRPPKKRPFDGGATSWIRKWLAENGIQPG